MRTTYLYFAACIGPDGADLGAIKIGCSGDVKRRTDRLSAGQPYTCKLLACCPGAFLEEAVIHEWLHADQISGEFFHDGPAVQLLISRTRETSRMPLAVHSGSVPLRWIDQSGVANFIAAHGLTLSEAAALTGRRLDFFEAGVRQKTPPRRVVAALAVAAIRKGGTVDWTTDFLAHEPELQRAA